MINWDINTSKDRFDKVIKLIDNNKKSDSIIFNFKTLLITGISFCIPFVFYGTYKV